MFQRYVASVVYRCCKSGSECCTCSNVYTYVLSVYSKCSRRMLQVFYLDVAYTCMLLAYVSSVSGVSYVCCKCFIWMLHMFATVFKCFQSFCFKCFTCLLLYVATVVSGCFKSRLGAAHGMYVGSS
jgi:hypothetical protein